MAVASEIPDEWYFITPPQNVSWSKSSQINDVQVYATNNPYIHYGQTGLRQLTLGDAMLEGFSDGKQVENNVIELEACMRIVLETDDGYAAPFCWEVYAGNKKYGTFIIDSVNVTESIRDNEGKAARANVDVSFREVAPYQVNAGIDITAEAITGNLSEETQQQLMEKNESQKQDDKAKDSKKDKDKDKNKGNENKNNSNSSNSSSSNGGSSSKPTDPNFNGGQKW